MKLIPVFSLLLLASTAVHAENASVANVRANMRSGKAENYRIIKVLPPQTEVEVLETDQDYVKVKTAEGQTGWVQLKLLNIAPKTEPEKSESHRPVAENNQGELRAARAEVEKLRGELEQERGRTKGEPSSTLLVLSAIGGLAAGLVIGILALRTYYIRRLGGLRI